MMRFSGLAIPGRLEGTDLAIAPGTTTALIGPNGGGKTSLLRAMAGIEGDGTHVVENGELMRLAPAQRARALGFLPASRQLAWPIPARDLLRLGPAPPDEARIAAYIDTFELDPLLDRPSDRLSTGERARLLLARLLATGPTLLLLDEPFANLDPYWVLVTADILAREACNGAAVVVALHDLSLADRFDRVLLMHEGRLVAGGPPSDILGSGAFRAAFRLQPRGGGWGPA